MIQVGDRLPEGQLVEFVATEPNKLGPKLFNVSVSVKGKRIAILAVSGPYTDDYQSRIEACKQAGVDEIWCSGTADPRAMATWSRELKAAGMVRMVSDGSGIYLRSLGVEAAYGKSPAADRGRLSLLVDDGILKQVNLEASNPAEASNDEMLAQVA